MKIFSYQEALETIIDSIPTVKEIEEINLFNAVNRFAAEDVKAELLIPPHHNSAMDGFAVKIEDIQTASEEQPVFLKIVEERQAGIVTKKLKLNSGEAIRIMTGAFIPDNANAVVIVEETEENNGKIKISRSLKKNENIRFAGEDMKPGDLLIKRGDLITPAMVGLLASTNLTTVKVSKQPTIAILASGNEIVEPGSPKQEGQIYNSNAYSLYAAIKKVGIEPTYLGKLSDSLEETNQIIKKAQNFDFIISSGGVSMGRYDFIKDSVKETGYNVLIEKLKIKPGRPMVFGTKSKKNFFFGLPGNPVSSLITFEEFVRPAIIKFQGGNLFFRPLLKAKIQENLYKKAGRKHFLRGKYQRSSDGSLEVSSTGPQGSGILTSMQNNNCLIILPSEITEIKKGDFVDIQLTEHKEI